MLMEMVERTPGNKGSNIIAFQGNIWRWDKLTDELANDIEEKTGISADHLRDEDYIDHSVIEERPDIFFGTIYNDMLMPQIYDELSHGPTSPLIKKIIDFYKLDGFQYDTSDDETHTTFAHAIRGDIPNVVYHGTNLKALYSIFKTGLNPSEENSTNWGFAFSDKIYLTSRLDVAMFHANNSSNKQRSHPIVLRIEIPDRSKITADYDVAAKYGMSEIADREDYTNIISQQSSGYDKKRQANIQKNSPKTDFTKASGIFAYKGRIPFKFIDKLIYRNDSGEGGGINRENFQTSDNKNDWPKIVEMLDEHGFYDPDYEDYIDEEEE
jgi:hypothetical protein